MSSNLIFTIWAVFGGFILHFLLCNFLTVLLRPRYEEPVETAADIVERNITLIMEPGSEIYRQIFAAVNDTNMQELSRTMVIAKSWYHYYVHTVAARATGLYAQIGNVPFAESEQNYKFWYRSSEPISGIYPYAVDLSNKKWPLKKVNDKIKLNDNIL